MSCASVVWSTKAAGDIDGQSESDCHATVQARWEGGEQRDVRSCGDDEEYAITCCEVVNLPCPCDGI